MDDEPTSPEGKLSHAGLKLGKTLNDEKTAPGHRFASIHDESTAPDGGAARRALDDEPTNPSATSPDDEETPVSESPSRGSRTKARRAIARAKGAMLISRQLAAGLQIESAMLGEWIGFAERGGFRMLVHDTDGHRCTALLKLAPKANLPASATTGPAEITVIAGTAFVSGGELNAGETCIVAEGTHRPSIASQDGAVLLFTGSDADECVRPR